ncbi:MAG: NAD-dependent epimerase/dehydratase family protein [Alphaproteobacteria bacterium]|nr:NAD-dependent epimerase/dehydratase family protein [Alphaproteobacteria bacterium]
MSQTILLTGITGFIAKAIAADLLNTGYAVRGSLRRPDRAQEVMDALAPRLTDRASLTRLSFVTLDLMADDGWAAAMEGVAAVIHTASPFPAKTPRQEADLIRPAVDGVLRALRAAEAAGVRRVVMTSSTAAIMQRELPDGTTVTAEMWSDLNHVSMTAYARSKTLAERAAWDFAEQHPSMQLTAINPSLVIGTPLDPHYGTSLRLIAQMISGKVPLMPNVGLALVDVADVAQAHVAALKAPDSIGRRILLVSDYVMARDLVAMLRDAAPQARLPRVAVPRLLARAIGLVSPQVRSLVPLIDKTLHIDNAPARDLLGIAFTPPAKAVAATVRALNA